MRRPTVEQQSGLRGLGSGATDGEAKAGFPVRLQAPGLRAGMRAISSCNLLMDKVAILRVAQGRDGSAQGLSVAPPPDLYITNVWSNPCTILPLRNKECCELSRTAQ